MRNKFHCALRDAWATKAVALVAMLVLGLIIPSSSKAQDGVTSLGTDFWIGMMPNYLTPANNIRIFVASSSLNTVHCDFFGGSPQPVDAQTATVQPDQFCTFYPHGTALAETRITETPVYKAIHVYSKNPIAVYAITNSDATTDSYLGLPIQALGTDYIASCYYDDHYAFIPDPLAGEFLLIAPYDDTHIHIGPVRCATRSDPSGTLAHDRGSEWDITLQKGQTYLVQSTGLNYGDDDLTGTPIKSDKPIGLISGHQRCSIPIGAPNDSKDHLCEMYPSIDRWGTRYYDMPMAGRTLCGDYIRLIAGDSGVRVTENGRQVAVLDHPGDFVDRELITEPTVYQSVDASGNPSKKRFLTVQMAYTYLYNNDPGQGDPFSIIMTPEEQFQRRLLFRCPDNKSGGGTYLHYATFICRMDSLPFIMINGKRITSYQSAGMGQFPGTSNPVMGAIRIKGLESGPAYLATSGAPFGAYLYGFTDVESYGHPAGMALRIVTPDPIAPAEVRDSSCGEFHVELEEVRHQKPDGPYDFEDSRISEFAYISDSNDLRWSKPGYNFKYDVDSTTIFKPGDSVAFYSLRVIDLTKNAYGAVWTTDLAGNDSVYEYYYYAPKVSMNPSENPVQYRPVSVRADSCRRFVFVNEGNNDLNVSSVFPLGAAKAGTFTVSPSNISGKVAPGDSLVFNVCFTPTDTLVSDDTIILQTGCVPFRYAVEGLGVTPIIYAEDLDFGGVPVGDTACKDLKISNIGTAPLVIDSNWLLKNGAHFFFRDASTLPVTIQPGQSHVFDFCYSPSGPQADSGQQNWGTNIHAPFEHMKKDTSILRGYGLQPGLNWDRKTQNYTVECTDTQMVRVNLVNPFDANGSTVQITKVQIEGPDASEFSIVDNQLHYSPLNNTPEWPLDNGQTIWVDVVYKPDISKGYGPRTASLVAYGYAKGNPDKTFTPTIALTATVRHSIVRVTPPSYDFGVVVPNTPVSGDFWIHNDGDTTLVLGALGVSGGNYTVTGASLGQKIAPGDSVKVTVSGTSIVGDMTGTLQTNGSTDCDTVATNSVKVLGANVGVAGTGYDFGNQFVCKTDSTLLSATNTGSQGTILASVRILDTLGSTGANQYRFSDGTRQQVLNLGMAGGSVQQFMVHFQPQVGGGTSAYVLYTFLDTTQVPALPVYVLKTLDGVPLYYPTVLSLHKDYGDQVYSANTGDILQLPVQMKIAFDSKAQVYGMQFTVRYRRDEFQLEAGGIQLAPGLSLDGTPTEQADPLDPQFALLPIKLSSTNPITSLDTVMHIPFRYVIAKDTTSPFQIMAVSFADNTGANPCWVVADTISGTFYGKNLCGDATIRNMVRGLPLYSIQKVTPNPISHLASVQYDVNVNNAPMTIELYDVLGGKVMTVLKQSNLQKGIYSAHFDVSSLPGGTYTLRASSMGVVTSQQIVVQQ